MGFTTASGKPVDPEKFFAGDPAEMARAGVPRPAAQVAADAREAEERKALLSKQQRSFMASWSGGGFLGSAGKLGG